MLKLVNVTEPMRIPRCLILKMLSRLNLLRIYYTVWLSESLY